jgi:hypothetical protein
VVRYDDGGYPRQFEKKGRGTISFFFCFSPEWHRAITIHLDGKLVGVSILPLDLPAEQRERFKSYQTDFDQAKDTHLRSREMIERILEVSGLADEAAGYKAAIAGVTNEFYCSKGLFYTSDDKLENARTMLKNDGLLKIADGDFASIEALAQLSLYNSLSWDKPFLEKCMAAVGVDLSTLVKKLELSRERFGVPLVRDFSSALYVFV